MMVQDLLGTVIGTSYTTDHIYTSHASDREAMRLSWKGGRAWRLSLLAEGQSSLDLPGRDILLERSAGNGPLDERHVVLVVAGRSCGLSSLNNWIVQGEQGFRAVAVDLDDIHRAGEDHQQQLKAAAEAIVHDHRFANRHFQRLRVAKLGDADGDEAMLEHCFLLSERRECRQPQHHERVDRDQQPGDIRRALGRIVIVKRNHGSREHTTGWH